MLQNLSSAPVVIGTLGLSKLFINNKDGTVAQLVGSLIADTGVVSSLRLIIKLSTVILLLQLIQEGLLSVTNVSMCTEY